MKKYRWLLFSRYHLLLSILIAVMAAVYYVNQYIYPLWTNNRFFVATKYLNIKDVVVYQVPISGSKTLIFDDNKIVEHVVNEDPVRYFLVEYTKYYYCYVRLGPVDNNKIFDYKIMLTKAHNQIQIDADVIGSFDKFSGTMMDRRLEGMVDGGTCVGG